MRPLNQNNVRAIHDLYPASEIECVQVFEKLIGTLPGFGIFIQNTDELCAWMMHSYYGAMFSMQTKPQFRRKGWVWPTISICIRNLSFFIYVEFIIYVDRYGIHLALALTNKVIERGYTPFVVIRPENDASRSLYTKLGYKKAYETVRVTLQPRATSDTAIGKLNGHCANGHIIDIQKDEGIEDMRALEIVQNISLNQNEVAKDEGIDNGEE